MRPTTMKALLDPDDRWHERAATAFSWLLWFVSQDRPRIEVYRTGAGGKLDQIADLGPGAMVTSPLLPGCELSVDALNSR